MNSTTTIPSADDAAGRKRLARRIDAALPQTQCTRCGYPDCAGYAHAIAFHDAPINQCPPGGAQGIARLGAITGRPVVALNPQHGSEAPRRLALIDEAACIGCTLCRDVCPTDAILGVAKHMHTVIEPRCTGCELCVPACPVDCIALENASGERTGWAAWSQPQADAAREHYRLRTLRLARERAQACGRPEPAGTVAPAGPRASDRGASEEHDAQQAARTRRDVVETALARARQRAKAQQEKPDCPSD